MSGLRRPNCALINRGKNQIEIPDARTASKKRVKHRAKSTTINITSRSCETSFLGATASKKKGWMGGGTIAGEHQRAPRTVGCPRPRVQVTWADERAAHGLC